MLKNNGLKKGFTLVELIVVIAIIGILAAILIPSMVSYVRSAKLTTANEGAQEIYKSAVNYSTELTVNGNPLSVDEVAYDDEEGKKITNVIGRSAEDKVWYAKVEDGVVVSVIYSENPQNFSAGYIGGFPVQHEEVGTWTLENALNG